MKIEVHLLRYGDDWLFGYVIRHYQTMGARIIVHDATPGARADSYQYGEEPHQGISTHLWGLKEVNDLKYMEMRNNCWKGTDADWVIVADLDELIYFPEGAEESLGAYTQKGAVVIRPHGFEMFSETYPTTSGQIYDEITMGAPDDKWYAKPILFAPQRLEEIGLGMGSHEADPILKGGRRLHVGPNWPFAKPECRLLHCHQIGPESEIAAKYDATKARMCKENLLHNWGNTKPGAIHVAEKRALICPNLRQVVP